MLALALCHIPLALAACDETTSLVDRACKHVTDTWQQGGHDLYLPVYTYHIRSAHTQEELDSYREDTLGLGYGRSRYNESGNWEGLYGMAFEDSHSKLQYIAGYGYQWMWGEQDSLHAGLGYTVFLTARSNISHYTPVPGILPIASINYRQASLNATFVPPYSKGNGNLYFFWARLGF